MTKASSRLIVGKGRGSGDGVIPPTATVAATPEQQEATLGEHAIVQVNRLLEKREGRRGNIDTRKEAPPNLPPAMTRRGDNSTAKGAATMHNNAILADAAAAADRGTQQQRRQRKRRDPREDQHARLGACGAPATRTERELDDENLASSRAAAAAASAATVPVADANVAAVYAAAATAAAVKHETIDAELNEGDEEEEWEEQGLHDYDAMAYDDLNDDLARGGGGGYGEEEDEEQEDEEEEDAGVGAGGKSGVTVRRMTAEERADLRATHRTHLLCLLARGAMVDAAASDPLLAAMASSVLPRDVAFAVSGCGGGGDDHDHDHDHDERAIACPKMAHVAQLAKWFAANLDLSPAGGGVNVNDAPAGAVAELLPVAGGAPRGRRLGQNAAERDGHALHCAGEPAAGLGAATEPWALRSRQLDAHLRHE